MTTTTLYTAYSTDMVLTFLNTRIHHNAHQTDEDETAVNAAF